MNVFRAELRLEFVSFLKWCFGILVFLLAFVPMRVIFLEEEEAFHTYLSAMPPEFSSAFGINVDTIFMPAGYYSLIYYYVGLAAAIMALALSLSIFLREKRAFAEDFLLTRPLARKAIFMAKFGAGVCLLLVFFVLYTLALFFSYGKDLPFEQALMFGLGLFCTQLLFFSLGSLVAVLQKKALNVAGVATALGFSAFILTMLDNLFEQDISAIAPLAYFNVSYYLDHGHYEPKLVLIAFAVFLASGTASFIVYNKKNVY